MKNLTAQFLTASFTSDKNTVFCVFIDSLFRLFVVRWDRYNDDEFDISLDVMSETNELNGIIAKAISEGESDDNCYLALYLSIRDSFDRNDCKNICEQPNADWRIKMKAYAIYI